MFLVNWYNSSLLLLLIFDVVAAYQPLRGVRVVPLKSKESVDVGEWLSSNGRCMIIFGTYAADFNCIEYGQRLRYYWPKLQQEKGIQKCAFILNCQPKAAELLLETIDLVSPPGLPPIQIWLDNTGNAGRIFGVNRGWLPDSKDINPFLKLFGMLWGLGAYATLPAVIGGYIGNPFRAQPWIEDALVVGQCKQRWPDTALELSDDGEIIKNKFSDLPLVGGWPRRPLELATLRLQSMLGISLAYWDELAPNQEALDAGVLTQLGGCLVVENGKELLLWKDPGICAVLNFEDIMDKL